MSYHLPNRYTWIEFVKGLSATSKSTYYLHAFLITPLGRLAQCYMFEAMRQKDG
jgi:hypothetical protein